jgi:hypothetical protein
MCVMSSGPAKYSREYYLERAEEMRTIAELMSHDEPKQKMLGVAASYIWLADRAREKAVAPDAADGTDALAARRD